MKERGIINAKFLSVLISLIFIIPFVSAEITFEGIENSYNLGETILLDLTLSPEEPTNGFLKLELVCGSAKEEVYRAPYSVNANENKIAYIDLYLGRAVIGELSGSCYLRAYYGNEDERSKNFRISKAIDVKANIEKTSYNPGDLVYVSGEGLLENGAFVEGFVETSLEKIKIEEDVIGGIFSFEFEIPEDIEPGRKELVIKVYEKDITGEITNEGEIKKSFEVKEILSELEIILNSQSIIPGKQELVYTIKTYNQAGKEMSNDARVIIYYPDGKIFSENSEKTSKEIILNPKSDSSSGYWKIIVSIDEFQESKLIYFEEVELVDFRIENNTLVVKNIGNIDYDGPLEVLIGNEKVTRNIKLKYGETKSFRLRAPDNNYEISVRAGENEFSASGVLLTGRAIDIGEVDSKSLSLYVLFLLVFIFIIALAIVLWYKKRKGIFGKKKNNLESAHKKIVSKHSVENNSFVQGKKEDACIVSLRLGEVPKGVEQTIESALLMAKSSGAKVYISGEYRIMLFSPTLTKQQENSTLAAKVAKGIEEVFNSRNRRAREKLSFGLGINFGQIILESHGGNLKPTSLGNLIPLAKKLSTDAKEEVLISKEIRGKLSGEVKTQAVYGEKVWKIKEVINRDNKGFSERFK